MWNRIDICEAWYLYATLFHGGMGSPEYRIFGRLERLGFKARPSLRWWGNLSENAQEIYHRLVRAREK